MASRRDWDALSPAYRRRLESGGITRSSYESGVPLAKARGHAGPRGESKKPKGVGPNRTALEKLILNVATDRDRQSVEKWYRDRSPAWLRSRELGADVAGQIYYANLRPEFWQSVDVYPQRGGGYMVYITSTRGGPVRKFAVSDAEAASEVVAFAQTRSRARRREVPDVTWHETV